MATIYASVENVSPVTDYTRKDGVTVKRINLTLTLMNLDGTPAKHSVTNTDEYGQTTSREFADTLHQSLFGDAAIAMSQQNLQPGEVVIVDLRTTYNERFDRTEVYTKRIVRYQQQQQPQQTPVQQQSRPMMPGLNGNNPLPY